MKKINILFFSLLSLLFFACDDYSEEEFVKYLGEELTEDIPITKTQNSPALLFEEHTAWQCSNCPEGAEKVETLKESFQKDMIVVAIHAGLQAIPRPKNNNLDLRTTYGNILATNIDSRPSAIINRNSTSVLGSLWNNSLINNALSEMAHSLNIGLGIKEKEDKILIGVECNFLENINGELLLSLLITEDHIIGVQADERITEGYNSNYEFNNVLRSNPLIDMPLNNENIIAQETIKKTYAINIDEGWNLSNCKVIAIVTNKNNGKVLQANEISIR